MFVLRMRPVYALEGVTDDVHTAATREELVEFYNNQRCAPYYEDSNGRKVMRHHKKGGPLVEYLPINVEHVDGDGAGIYEDNTRIPLTQKQLKPLTEECRRHPANHPTLVHQLLATIECGPTPDQSIEPPSSVRHPLKKAGKKTTKKAGKKTTKTAA